MPPWVFCLDCDTRRATSIGWHDDGTVADAVCADCAVLREEAASAVKGDTVMIGGVRRPYLRGMYNDVDVEGR